MVFPHLALGGGERVMMDVAEGLGRDFRLELCALDHADLDGAASARRELADRFPQAAFLSRRWQLLTALGGADVALWYGLVNAVPRTLARLTRRPASIRVVHTEREVDGLRFHRRWRRQIDGTVCVVPRIARRLPGAAFIPNTCCETRLAGRRRQFFPAAATGRKTLGFLGRLVPLKNVPWLLDQLRSIDCNLLIQALDTPWLTVAELRDRVARRGLGSRVRFLPAGRDVGTLLRSVDALAVVSSSEGFPTVVVEAGMVGVPVIASRVGALPELFADEILWLDRDGDVPSAASLRRALAAVTPRAGLELQRRVRALCSKEAVVARYRDYIHEVVDRRRAALAATG